MTRQSPTQIPSVCWLIHGSTSIGGAYCDRQFNEAFAHSAAAEMNRLGASVEVTRQVLKGNKWRDDDAEGGVQ